MNHIVFDRVSSCLIIIVYICTAYQCCPYSSNQMMCLGFWTQTVLFSKNAVHVTPVLLRLPPDVPT